jgi:hypothetical protein
MLVKDDLVLQGIKILNAASRPYRESDDEAQILELTDFIEGAMRSSDLAPFFGESHPLATNRVVMSLLGTENKIYNSYLAIVNSTGKQGYQIHPFMDFVNSRVDVSTYLFSIGGWATANEEEFFTLGWFNESIKFYFSLGDVPNVEDNPIAVADAVTGTLIEEYQLFYESGGNVLLDFLIRELHDGNE